MEKRQIGFGNWYKPPNLDKYYKEITDSRRLTYGPFSERFEKEFAAINGCKYMIFCSSGTMALYASLLTLKNLYPALAQKRKYVVVPSTTFISDSNVVSLLGFEPLFIDVASTYNLSYEELDVVLRKYHGEIFAVMPSSLMGRPVDGLRIKSIIDVYDPSVFFILDSCENVASKFDNHFPEASAHFTAWSFYISHLLTVGAVGGMIGTNDEKLAIQVRSVINHGRNPVYTSIDSDNNVSEAILRDITAKRFQFVQEGINGRCGEIEAAFGLSMLEDNFMGQMEKRRRNAAILIQRLGNLPLVLPKWNEQEHDGIRFMMLPIRVAQGDKWDLVHYLESKGIETRDILPMYSPVTEKYFGSLLNFRTNFPMSHEIYTKGFYVASHQYLTEDDINYMVEVFEGYFKK